MADTDFFIDDGYFANGQIAALDGVHGPLQFVYRPMIHADKETYYELAKRPGVTPSQAIAQVLAQHIHHWSLPREIALDNLLRLRPRLLERLFYIVMGELASDRGDENQGQLTTSDQEVTDLKN